MDFCHGEDYWASVTADGGEPQRHDVRGTLRLVRCLQGTLRGGDALFVAARAGLLSYPALEDAEAEADVLRDDELVQLRVVSAAPLPSPIAVVGVGYVHIVAGFVHAADASAAHASRLGLGASGGRMNASGHSRRSFAWNCLGVGRSSNASDVVHEDRWYGDIVLRFRGHLRSLASTWWSSDARRSGYWETKARNEIALVFGLKLSMLITGEQRRDAFRVN